MPDQAVSEIGIIRQPAKPFQPVIDPAGWTRQSLAARADWIYQLTEADVACAVNRETQPWNFVPAKATV